MLCLSFLTTVMLCATCNMMEVMAIKVRWSGAPHAPHITPSLGYLVTQCFLHTQEYKPVVKASQQRRRGSKGRKVIERKRSVARVISDTSSSDEGRKAPQVVCHYTYSRYNMPQYPMTPTPLPRLFLVCMVECRISILESQNTCTCVFYDIGKGGGGGGGFQELA